MYKLLKFIGVGLILGGIVFALAIIKFGYRYEVLRSDGTGSVHAYPILPPEWGFFMSGSGGALLVLSEFIKRKWRYLPKD